MKSKVLVIGGTGFIGRVLVEKLIETDNYNIHLLNRGKTNTSIFPEIPRLVGDRDTDISHLIKKEPWDYIIDMSCYNPVPFKDLINAVSDEVKKYIFISTCSVYDIDCIVDSGKSLNDENTQLLECSPEQAIDKTMLTYGNRKVACEKVLENSNLNYCILRPGLVYGKYDFTDRFYYWLHQVKKYDPVMIENKGENKLSLTYVEDIAKVVIKSMNPEIDKEAYNMMSQTGTSIASIISHASDILKKAPDTLSVPSSFLKENKVNEWQDLPLWIDGSYFTFDNKKLLDRFQVELTPFRKAIESTISYYDQLNWPIPKYGLKREKQLELIELATSKS